MDDDRPEAPIWAIAGLLFFAGVVALTILGVVFGE
jgi:hypothetical protein